MHPPDETATHSYAPEASGELTLVVTSPAGIQTFSLEGKRLVTVGRGEAAHILVADPSVSRKHVMIVVDPLMLQDCGSHNGTYLSGNRLEPEVSVPLPVGAPFVMGSVTAFVRPALPEDSAVSAGPASHASDVVVEDPAMKNLYERLDVVAPSGLNLLVLGETGVGKEVFAEALHARSERTGAFLQLNCAALPESILEGELFGYEKGAFTGAAQAKGGLFEAADGGTIFLDEIGELPLATQAKLLRVLESGEILRLGARKTTRVDVRFIGATHRDLRAMVAAGTFRQDLFYRINGLSLTIPPLRMRHADIAPLANFFVSRSKRPQIRFSAEALSALRHYPWPGNIRELRNVIARAAVLCRTDVIGVDDLALEESSHAATGTTTTEVEVTASGASFNAPTIFPPAASGGAGRQNDGPAAPPGGTLDESVREFERSRILSALDQAGGNQTRAAQSLGISRHALAYRMKELGIASRK